MIRKQGLCLECGVFTSEPSPHFDGGILICPDCAGALVSETAARLDAGLAKLTPAQVDTYRRMRAEAAERRRLQSEWEARRAERLENRGLSTDGR